MLKKVLQYGALALTFLGAVNATTSDGYCQKVTIKQNFDVTKYVGTWFEQARDVDFNYEFFDCNQAHYTLNTDNSIAVVNSEYDESMGQISSKEAKAVCEGSSAKCKVYFVPFIGGDYQVLDTDYENFAIVYSCGNKFFTPQKDELVWILTREETISAELDAQIKEIIETKTGYNTTKNFRTTKQGGSCKYLQ